MTTVTWRDFAAAEPVRSTIMPTQLSCETLLRTSPCDESRTKMPQSPLSCAVFHAMSALECGESPQ